MDEKDYARLVDCIESPVELEAGQLYIRKGMVARMNGFRFVVYSDDHGKHFHIIHRERGIDARFSFPNIKLIDYKQDRNTISSKEENNIRVFFENPIYFAKLKKDFEKRDSS